MCRVFLGLGSNLGDRLQHLSDAVREINHMAKIQSISSVYRTEPFGMKSDHEFYNAAIEIETLLDPPDLLQKLKNIEKKLGRSPHTHMKDREIDIDILLYSNLYYEEHTSHSIEVPHPDLVNRKFALIPLNEIASVVLHPIYGEAIGTLLHRCKDRSVVERTAMQLHYASSHS